MPEEEDELFVDERKDVDRPMLRLFTAYGRRHPKPMVLALGSNALSPLLGLAPAYLLAFAIDTLFPPRQRAFAFPLVPQRYLPTELPDQIVFTFILMIATYTLVAGLTWLGSWGWAIFAEHVQHDLRTDVYDKMQRLGMEFFADKQAPLT